MNSTGGVGTSDALCLDAGVYAPARETAPVSTSEMQIPALVSTAAVGKMEKVSTKLD